MRDELSICLEKMVNDLADRQFLSKEQKENMYREWAGIGQDNTIQFYMMIRVESSGLNLINQHK